MRSIASSLAIFCSLVLHAQSDSAQQEQTLNHIKQFASTLDHLSCVEAPSPGSAMSITVEFTGPRKGTPSTLAVGGLLQEVFAPSSQAEFHRDHVGTIAGRKLAAYNYSFRIDGKTRAGSIYADENTGAITRIIFRGADAPAHLFCSAQTR